MEQTLQDSIQPAMTDKEHHVGVGQYVILWDPVLVDDIARVGQEVPELFRIASRNATSHENLNAIIRMKLAHFAIVVD